MIVAITGLVVLFVIGLFAMTIFFLLGMEAKKDRELDMSDYAVLGLGFLFGVSIVMVSIASVVTIITRITGVEL